MIVQKELYDGVFANARSIACSSFHSSPHSPFLSRWPMLIHPRRQFMYTCSESFRRNFSFSYFLASFGISAVCKAVLSQRLLLLDISKAWDENSQLIGPNAVRIAPKAS